ncbi:hypothetical protein ABMA28_013187 [Loxostege sticticalis]|uniref:THAP-type domain-containing protein n=1 Tax=Loxostege sticticalis TaxID=481309 RepID=A0ABD0THG3_LOXSC
MPNCAILSCKNSTRNVGWNNGNISFHRFPNDPSIKEKWIDATGQKNWFRTKYITICSFHFNIGSFAETNKNRRLTADAIPTIDCGGGTERRATHNEKIHKPLSSVKRVCNRQKVTLKFGNRYVPSS